MNKIINIPFSIFALLIINVTTANSQPCGPGPHWVDACAAGTDTIECDPLPYVELEIEFPWNDCIGPFGTAVATEDTPTIVSRDNPTNGGCFPPTHDCKIETEILSLSLTGSVGPYPMSITVGVGRGIGPLGGLLQPSSGSIIELPGDSLLAQSCFGVFFEICIIRPTDTIYLYNQIPHQICAIIDRVPPLCITRYRAPLLVCLGLFTEPINGGLKFASMRGADHVLPVELSSFNSIINARNVTLNWITAAEENNSGFEIERSNLKGQTSNDWSKIGFVTGQGNSSVANNYSFEDRNLSSGRYNYRLKQIDYNGNFKYFDLQNEVIIGVAEKFGLSQNYPNPFNPMTKINYDISKDGSVKLIIYDNVGREIKTLVNEFRSAGYYTVDFEAANLPSGVYFYKLESNNFIATKKMVIMK